MSFKSIQVKIAAIAGLCLIIVAGLLVGYNLVSASNTQVYTLENVSKLEERNSLASLTTLANEQAGVVKSEFELALDAARNMASAFEVSKMDSGDKVPLKLERDHINAILKNVLENNPDFNGTYSCWELNALDGRDAEFKTGKDGNNKDTGRFTPYWNRDSNGNIAVQPLVEYDTMEKHPNGVLKGGWYIGPSKDHIESVLDPLPYIVQGKKVYLATMSVPIMVDGKFYGVAGADYDLSFAQKLAVEADKGLFDGKGEFTIISNMGLIVADSEKPEFIGEHLKNLIPDGWETILADIQAGKEGASFDGNGLAVAFGPITLGRTGKPWSVLIRVPKDIILAEVHALGNELTARQHESTIWQAGVSLVVTLLAIIALWLAAGGIARPIKQAALMADSIREGDFSQRLTISSKDEVGQLGVSLNGMADSLQKAVMVADKIANNNLDVEVSLASDHDQLGLALQKMAINLNSVLNLVQATGEEIANGASQSSDASQSLSQATTQSAASLEEITASISEIGSQTNQNSENAQQANTLASAARDSAATGGQRMEEMNAAMQNLNESAEKIAKIIKVIDEIAFQTNLLALNAAVEAARAGSYGKGFAVVAEEVRNLAGRSAKAAEETAVLLESNGELVTKANSIAKHTGEALGEIVDGITKAADLVGEIASASAEQAHGVAQISQGLTQIESATQQNTANAEETASVSQELSGQAQVLHEILSKFELKKTRGDKKQLTQQFDKTSSHTSNEWPENTHSQVSSQQKVNKSLAPQMISPRDEIKLDDDEFGKF